MTESVLNRLKFYLPIISILLTIFTLHGGIDQAKLYPVGEE